MIPVQLQVTLGKRQFTRSMNSKMNHLDLYSETSKQGCHPLLTFSKRLTISNSVNHKSLRI